MKKTIISLSIVSGLVLCGWLNSSNKAIEVKNGTKSNISIAVLSESHAMGNTICLEDPGITPPASKESEMLLTKNIA